MYTVYTHGGSIGEWMNETGTKQASLKQESRQQEEEVSHHRICTSIGDTVSSEGRLTGVDDVEEAVGFLLHLVELAHRHRHAHHRLLVDE